MKVHRLHTAVLFLAVAALGLAGCADADDEAAEDLEVAEEAPAIEQPAQAAAQLEPTAEGEDVTGRVTFAQENGEVRVIADVQGLSEGVHGFHVHENGDCSNNAQAAGGHYNPVGDPHGAPTDPLDEHHVGDMGNIVADASGMARLDTTFAFLTLEGDTSIVGKAVVVHQGEDDFVSQPSGDAGARAACGVIEMAGGAATDTAGVVDTTGM